MTSSVPMPLDVRLMNVTTSLLVTSLVLACVAAGLWWALRNPAFAIDRITVGGDTTHNSATSLRAAVAPKLSGNFFTLDLSAARAAFQSAPWVRRAMVQREFPNQLHITLQEHVPVAHWGDGDTELVNQQGEVFEVGDSEAEEGRIPRLQGPEGQAPVVLSMLRQLSPLLEPLGARLAGLTLQARGNWVAELDRGAVIELGQGSPQELAARLNQFVGTVKEVAARHQRTLDAVETADLRHVGGYALRMRGVTTVRGDATPGTPAPAAAPVRR
ncbi:FtsQ-type POTRA domain-containing protein [Ottowia sp. GY511]|uniref:Cell division protein FtsQ n=1 Tax=Ottowia flava TaxID=2675430 RepID=A0ABW4KPX6_9BURK|nr:cell division protein FtsQ/DivIB [Ottowia sp. GY511]TXK32885.1 FtsQ-type POTRA domain-containing protein [Ottowia sp. GY511]